MSKFSESTVEDAALEWFERLGYTVLHGPEIAHDGTTPERESYGQVILPGRLRLALERINPDVPAGALDETLRVLSRIGSPSLIETNRAFHKFLTDGVDVEYRDGKGPDHHKVWLFDFNKPDNNDWVAVNQFTVIENNHNRRPDIVVMVNGLPLAVIELKNPADEDADIWKAFNQLGTYRADIPSLFTFNEVMVISDATTARVGSLTADKERFMPWRTVEGDAVAAKDSLEFEVLLNGIFEKFRFLDLMRNFVVFNTDEKGRTIKKLAGYHQYHAVNKAVTSTVSAASPKGDRKIGVVWHTQGSGKSLSMAFYAGKIVLALDNPTIVVITDRNDLDDQLFGTFAACKDLLRQTPEHVGSRGELREVLKRASGGVIFTTMHKFLPEPGESAVPVLCDRRNIVVIADEAHRSQYGFKARVDQKSGDIKYGLAKHLRDALPKASFIGFTGTPIETEDKSTPAVFGDYIDVYDIERAVQDKATVPIYYESRLAKLDLDERHTPKIDEEFEEVTEDEEIETKEKLKSKWAALEALVGADDRVKLIALDLVEHFENRLAAMNGKAMIVCMSRRICVAMYEAIRKLRPQWHDEDDAKGALKVVMTGSASDPEEYRSHVRNKQLREKLAGRFKDPSDPLKLVIVRDMWLTGFDAPCMHTMYLDKPMRGHGLMQAIARVNRVFGDKPGGLVVDYLGLADSLKRALSVYTSSGGTGKPTFDEDDALAILDEKYEIVAGMYHGFDYSVFFSGKATGRVRLLPQAMEHIFAQNDGKKRYDKAVAELSKAYALVAQTERAIAMRDEVAFFQAVRAIIVKNTIVEGRSPEDIDTAVRQIISRAVVADGVVDIFKVAGLDKPDISIFSNEFLEDVRRMPQKNLAVEALRKLLNDEIKTRGRRNVVQVHSFLEKLKNAMLKYQNRSIEAAAVLAELIEIAKEFREAQQRGEQLKLNDDELAFYDALANNTSAREAMGDDKLKVIATLLVQQVRDNAAIDWKLKESVRAKLRTIVKRVLKQYGYPPDLQDAAVQLVLRQAEELSDEWATNGKDACK